MSIWISKEKVQRSFISPFVDFWQKFLKRPQGVIGLIILAVYILAAVFAPFITRFDPQRDRYLAESMAMPYWVRVLPAYRDRSVSITREQPFVDFEPVDGSEIIYAEHEGNVEVFFRAENVRDGGGLVLTSPFDYHYTPPRTFEFVFDHYVEELDGAEVRLAAGIKNPSGAFYPLWEEQYSSSVGSWRTRKIDSRSRNINRSLGMSPFENIAEAILAESGTYQLQVMVDWEAEREGASGRLLLGQTTFNILGQLHGFLGTDNMGADLWSQLVYGTRISLVIGLLTAFIAVIIGTTVGIVSGYWGGTLDDILMRVTDMMLSIPVLAVLIILSAFFGKHIGNIIILVALFSWMGTARLVRSQTLSLRERSFVEVARAQGATDGYIMLRHILPNVIPLLFASLVLLIPTAIIYEATLSFLGFGDPTVPTWGRMLHAARGFGAFIRLAWWWALPPGLAITLMSLSFVLIGNTIDEILNPKHKERN